MTKDEGVLSRIKALTIDTRRWENLNDLLEFSELVKRAFPKFQGNIVGFDDPNYLIFSLLYSDLGFDDSKMPIRVMPKDGNDRENQRLDLDNFFNEESRANQLLRGYFKFLKRLIKERVV